MGSLSICAQVKNLGTPFSNLMPGPCTYFAKQWLDYDHLGAFAVYDFFVPEEMLKIRLFVFSFLA